MEFREVITKRRSVRSFLSKPIPEDVLREIMESARYAPTPGNGQSFCFGIIKDKNRKKELAQAAGGQEWIATAPVVIACCAVLDEDQTLLPEDDFGLIVNHMRFGEEWITYLNEYADRKMVRTFWSNAVPLIPGEHIFLSAVNHGLSACWIGFMDIHKTSTILNLPEDMACLFLMPIGYADEQPEDIYRKPYEEMVFHEQWNQTNGGMKNE